jgi:hypothetical protein
MRTLRILLINKLRVFLFPKVFLSVLCGESAPIKLKKAILAFFILDQLDKLINPTEERSIAIRKIVSSQVKIC